jgi:hypothetical protein
MSLSTPEIDAQVRRVLSSGSEIHSIAIRAQSQQPWPDVLNIEGRQFHLRWCASSLVIRQALCEIELLDPKTSGLVVLTPLATHEVAEDISARLARARVFQPEGWDIVRQMFKAKETDSRLGQFAWMPQTLIDGAARGEYAPVANGFLDLETAWRSVLERLLGFDTARPDAVALLAWSMDSNAETRWRLLPEKTRIDTVRWLGQSAGVAGEMVLGCLATGRLCDAIPLGLVCSVVFDPLGEGQAALSNAAVRLERYVDGKHVGLTEGRAWAGAAKQWIKTHGLDAHRALLDRADSLLHELRAADFVHLSDFLPAALDKRLENFAQALREQVADPSQARLAEVEMHADSALAHHLAHAQWARMERVEMARRLARWLLAGDPDVSSFPTAVAWQTDQGAFVDWARFRLLGGDELPQLSQAYNDCRAAVIARRNAFAQRFARSLVQWNGQKPAADGRTFPLEFVLDQVVAPLSAANPVLLLVMDGLSTSIFRELFARIESLGWNELVSDDVGKSLVGVAAIPTITEVSRASLLCGRLVVGAAPQEKTAFSRHPALLACSRADAPPRLFHKGDLSESTNLAQEVRSTIANPSQRVVGVVYNAVDDHLGGPDQLHQRWSLDDLRLLLPLLREAKDARRVVVITADHGHLLEDGTARLSGGESDRWRQGDVAVSADEMAVSGGRVVTPDGTHKVVCLWGESTRYAGKKNGYHGGLSPQEVTVPLSVFAPMGLNLTGWGIAPPSQPEWWELPPMPHSAPVVAQLVPQPKTAKRKSAPAPAQPELFEAGELPAVALSPSQATTNWIDVLFANAIYVSQRQLAARVAPPDEKMRLVLTALSERGGKLSRAALANRLSMPEVRVSGLLSAVRRILNVDQASVLFFDETTGTVELNLVLLQQQFGITIHAGAKP